MQLNFLLATLWLTFRASNFLAYALPNTLDIDERADGPKLVIAHFMVGNTFPYKEQDWKRAMSLASSKGIDAFALDMGRDDWQPARVSDAYKAAIGTGFKLFFTFDMGSLPCSKPEDGKLLRELVAAYSGHSNQLLYQGKAFVSAFGGQFCRFGTPHMDEGWTNVLKTDMVPIHFVPAFFMEPPILPSLKAIDGAFAWDSAWPMGNYDINSEYDDEYLTYLPGRTYMAGVSPWFFTHYSRDTYDKNLIYRGDNWHFASRWELLFKYRNKIDIVQVISWNDYGESHYVGPIAGAQPKSEAWTTGFDHQGWLDLMQYYITGYKTGAYPEITIDRIFLWGRLYPSQADAPDPIGKPVNFHFTQDFVWAVVFLTSPAHLELTCGAGRLATDLSAGVNKVRLALVDDCSVSAVITRGGEKTVDFAPPGYKFTKSPPTYNFNAFVAASPAA